MAYPIDCADCKGQTWAANIVDLIQHHTSPRGSITCSLCGHDHAYIKRESTLQEEGEVWQRCIRAAIPITTDYPTYTPYVFLTAESESGEPSGVHFNYYKDTRSAGGRLKHGHGPGGAPLFSHAELLQLLLKLGGAGFISPEDLEGTARALREARVG
jgi:hypothetical protein